MKKFCFVALLSVFLLSCTDKQPANVALVKGEVLSGNVKEVKFSWIVDNPINRKGESYSAKVDSTSKFSIEIPIERLATGRISAGGFYHDICLIPGDDMFVTIDADTILYEGKGASKNNYLYTTEVNRLYDRSFYKHFNKGKLSPEDFLKSLADFKKKRMDFFKTYRDSIEFQKEFINFYTIETEVMYEGMIKGYPRRYAYKNKISKDSLDLPELYDKYNCFSHIIDDSKLVSKGYLSNLRNHVYSKATEIQKVDTTLTWKDAMYVALLDSTSGKTKEYLLATWIVTELGRDSYDTLAIEKFQEIEKDDFVQITYDQALAKYNEKRTLIGQPLHGEFANTLLKDTSGIELSFQDMMAKYKGKVVYLDFWGMSCGPCRAAMPNAKKLKEKLADEPIEFVYLSVRDIKKKGWKKVYEVTLTKNNHYVVSNGYDSRLHKFMNINWVPCYMIFDKEGKLVNFNAKRPSRISDKYETQLEKELKEVAAI